MTDQNDFLQQSVTAGDNVSVTTSGGVLRLMVPFLSIGATDPQAIGTPPQPPPYWTFNRDAILRATVFQEAMWAASVGIAITKMASLSWSIVGDIPLRVKKAQSLLLSADGSRYGWSGFLAKQVRDYLTCDNGSHFEIVRATSALGSKITGLRHLSSLRCMRTGDPDIPIIYRDRRGRWHELKDYQVVSLADMPDADETYYGVGLCAASRAYNAIYKMTAIEWYLREKVAGLRPLAIYIVNGMMDNQIKNAVKSAEEDVIAKGVTAYMGAVIIGTPKDSVPQLVTIPLAELPDRFDRKEEFDIALLTYANSIGLDPQELQPLTGQSLGSGAQSAVLDSKEKGKGLSFWRQAYTHGLNQYVLDEMSTFAFIEKDYRDMKLSADISKLRADAAKIRVDSTITTPAQELQVMVDMDELPKEFLPSDQTPSTNLDDTEKPETEDQPEAEPVTEPIVEDTEEKEHKSDCGCDDCKTEKEAPKITPEIIAEAGDLINNAIRKLEKAGKL